jgi:hypothetical protein
LCPSSSGLKIDAGGAKNAGGAMITGGALISCGHVVVTSGIPCLPGVRAIVSITAGGLKVDAGGATIAGGASITGNLDVATIGCFRNRKTLVYCVHHCWWFAATMLVELQLQAVQRLLVAVFLITGSTLPLHLEVLMSRLVKVRRVHHRWWLQRRCWWRYYCWW